MIHGMTGMYSTRICCSSCTLVRSLHAALWKMKLIIAAMSKLWVKHWTPCNYSWDMNVMRLLFFCHIHIQVESRLCYQDICIHQFDCNDMRSGPKNHCTPGSTFPCLLSCSQISLPSFSHECCQVLLAWEVIAVKLREFRLLLVAQNLLLP